MPIKVFNFAGKRPVITPRLLPIGYAQTAQNTKVGSGAIECFDGLGSSVASVSSPATIYKFGSTWMEWAARQWIEKASISGTARILYADGSGYPLQQAEGGTAYRWGVKKPETVLSAGFGGTEEDESVVEDSVSYAYTLVTAYGEESDIFTPTAVKDVYTGQYISLQNWCIRSTNHAPWLALYGNDIVSIRVYRLASGEDDAEYQRVYLRQTVSGSQVDEIPVADISGSTDEWYDVNDSGDGISQSLGSSLITEGWDPAPDGMEGACMFANGIYAGAVGNLLYLSVPGYYYAFPASGTMDYTVELAYAWVAMAVFNDSLVVGTTGYPEIISGTDPAFITRSPLPFQQPCLSGKGMVSLPDGVAYPSPDGLFFVSSSGGRVLTANVFDRDTWNELPLSDMICVYHNQRIWMFFAGYNYGIIYDRDLDYVVDISPGITVSDVFVDPVEDILYLADTSGVYAWEGSSASELTAVWESGIMETPPANFGAGRVEGTFPSGHSTSLAYYVDGELKHTQTVTDNAPFRLPSGFRGREHELKITFSKSTINAIYLASDMGELANV